MMGCFSCVCLCFCLYICVCSYFFDRGEKTFYRTTQHNATLGGFFHVATLVQRLDLVQQQEGTTTAASAASAAAAAPNGACVHVSVVRFSFHRPYQRHKPLTRSRIQPNGHLAGAGTYLREMRLDPELCFALTSIHEVLGETEEVGALFFYVCFCLGPFINIQVHRRTCQPTTITTPEKNTNQHTNNVQACLRLQQRYEEYSPLWTTDLDGHFQARCWYCSRVLVWIDHRSVD